MKLIRIIMHIRFLVILLVTASLINNCSKKKDSSSENYKIFALSPSLVEMIFFLGKGGHLAGVSSFCNYPDAAGDIQEVSSVSDINLEYTLNISPDIVFLMPSQNEIEVKLKKLDINTVVVRQENMNDIFSSFIIIGENINASERARVVYDSLSAVFKLHKGLKKDEKILISVGREYGSVVSYIFSSGKTGFLNDIIVHLGYSNILDTTIPYPKIGAEAIMSLNPDIIIDLVPSNINQSEAELLADWKLYDNIDAWKNDNIHILKGDHTTIPGPRIFDFINELKETGL